MTDRRSGRQDGSAPSGRRDAGSPNRPDAGPVGRRSETAPSRKSSERANTVQVLVADEGNRAAVRELLAGRYDVVTDRPVREADLYLVDDHAFPRYEAELREQVERNHPVFCPVVLVRHRNARVDVSLPPMDEQESHLLVDDVVDAPLERDLIYRRLDSLLVRRDQSMDLKRHVSELEEREQELMRQNERLERFSSVLGHDLQNPLSVASGYAELLTEADDPENAEHAERVVEAVERMGTILDDLLVLAREGSDLGDVERVELGTLVSLAWDSVETKGATVEVGDLGTVEADPSRLRQAFENLFSNAVEHAGEDVSLRVEATAEGFAVEDDGPGIPSAVREQVFEDGYTSGDGTGLGLSIVRTVIEAHGWEVGVTDGTDGGSRFEVTGVEWVEE